jgi:hypothetical protein
MGTLHKKNLATYPWPELEEVLKMSKTGHGLRGSITCGRLNPPSLSVSGNMGTNILSGLQKNVLKLNCF